MVKSLYESYRGAMAYIEVELPNGDRSIGSAFHIGEGVFVTAKHVVNNVKILSMATTEYYYTPDDNGNATINGNPQKYRGELPKELTLKEGPFFHPNGLIDVAAIVCAEKDIIPIPLGRHLDDWINNSQFIMAETVVMGYPPIPFSQEPLLIVAKGEINAVVDKYNAPHPHFIISTMPKGGFSGGLCLIEWQFALGVIVESLVNNNRETELGFMSVITIEPIFNCLVHHNILPKIQKEGWGGLWDN
ncbi:MAG TPA: hypothetical protein DCS93_11885 [Microscillaceae bacterium]|nr:hypothetical protein [Microscillaceae bacterium]